MTTSSPVRPTTTILRNNDPIGYSNRILMGTPSRGTVRIEWHAAVRSMLVPPNWGMVTITQAMSAFIPVRFQVADAQNLIVRELLAGDFEWLLLLEDDVLPPPDLLIKLNDYMRRGDTPVVSGLYYTKADPSEPLIYRGRGTGAHLDWVLGEQVWCDGVPTGCLLVHHAPLRAIWDDSEEYAVGGQTTRRVFESAARSWIDPETGTVNTTTNTSDLDWCWRIKHGGYLAKAGWGDYADREYPFLVDTSIHCLHITPDGQVFPPDRFRPRSVAPPDLGIAASDAVEVTETLD